MRGTAFVVGKQALQSSQVRLLFLTNDHVVQDVCDEPLGYCQNMLLTGSFGVDTQEYNYIRTDYRDRSIHQVTVIKRHKDSDLALLEAIVDGKKYESLQPIPQIGSCNEISPGQEALPDWLPKYPSPNSPGSQTYPGTAPTSFEGEAKARSQPPFATGPTPDHAQHNVQWLGTTADALPGSSGGPALTPQGEFFGVLLSILDEDGDNDSQGYPYHGNARWHSFLTNCHATTEFLSPWRL